MGWLTMLACYLQRLLSFETPQLSLWRRGEIQVESVVLHQILINNGSAGLVSQR